MPTLSLVIPCYNEAKSLPALVERCAASFAGQDIEVILVDNGSTDDSASCLAALLAGQNQIRSVHVPVNQGYGYGILAGLRAAQGEILGWTHADLQTDPADVLRALPFFAQDRACLVKGKRQGRPLGDVVFTVGMSIFETLLLRRPLWDINAQPTLFPRSFFERWTNPPHDFSLDLFCYYWARRDNLPVRRFPVRFGERAHGVSHWNINWRAKIKFIKRTFSYSIELARKV